MPRGSQALTQSRRQEIIDACAALYETMGFKEITLRDISARTSFSRPSIYNYFQTKEEIFLALLAQEHEAWIADLNDAAQRLSPLCAEAFADMMGQTLERRVCMLKLMSMNLYDMEGNSRLENLVAFKRTYADALEAVARCLQASFPAMTPDAVDAFLYAFFPFLFGVYPYTHHTPKQLEAMAHAQVADAQLTIREIVRSFVMGMLAERVS